MSEWRKCKLGDVITFQRGHDLPKTKMNDGIYPVAGSNGIIGYHNAFTTEANGTTIGRSGNIGTPHFYKTNYWAHNTVLYVKDFKDNFQKFIYYFLRHC
jgi:type I restriction enzyme S subunit